MSKQKKLLNWVSFCRIGGVPTGLFNFIKWVFYFVHLIGIIRTSLLSVLNSGKQYFMVHTKIFYRSVYNLAMIVMIVFDGIEIPVCQEGRTYLSVVRPASWAWFPRDIIKSAPDGSWYLRGALYYVPHGNPIPVSRGSPLNGRRLIASHSACGFGESIV